MPVDYGFRRGIDLPEWTWLSMFPSGNSNHGAGCAYDPVRQTIYFAVQFGSTTGTASTAQLWAYNTVTDGWQFLASLASSNAGLDVEFDPVRRVVLIIHGANLTTAQVYNPTTGTVSVAGTAVAAQALSSAALPALPVAAGSGASLTQPDDASSIGALVPDQATALDGGTVLAGSTSTTLDAGPMTGATGTAAQGSTFGPGLVGLFVRMTSGPHAGQHRVITGVPNPNRLTIAALPGAPAAGDSFVVEVPELTLTGTPTTTTLVSAAAALTANLYRDADVVVLTGPAAGQRRRIASHTADTITLAPAYTAPAANPRVGPLTVAPAAGDVIRIVPSSDFLYYQPGNASAALYRIDLAQTGAAAAWSAALASAPGGLSGGANTFHAGSYSPFAIMAVRGSGTRDVYTYNIGLNTWATNPSFGGGETFGTGTSAIALHGKRRIMLVKDNSTRTYVYDVTTGLYDAGPTVPYAAAGGFDGHRARFVRTADGAEFFYLLRAGGPELFRLPVEWL